MTFVRGRRGVLIDVSDPATESQSMAAAAVVFVGALVTVVAVGLMLLAVARGAL